MDFIICFANEGSIKSPSEPLFLVIDISICSNSGLNVITSSGSFTFDIFCINSEEIAGLTASDNSSGLSFFQIGSIKLQEFFLSRLWGLSQLINFLK